jgi:EAL domain-containing protein (putative c-di-GMP-specific phosphodiesterase class I)
VPGAGTSGGAGRDAGARPPRLAQSLVEFAHSFDVSVVAEGVETAAEHAVLRSLGVDGGQGWLFGRPAPADVLVGTGTVLAPAPLTA